ncbi:4-hydroxythreonine-4-phosphate dehydrogenase PdxA [Alkalinema sp. FACHB-956]|uniref:4-hydroxythreonine-4-phosphate dehydrogenase PdxA n=1 Tax=Alkalinema sp. FACHB-956 TaxID=2692768 RepID=UPI001686FEF5|nr:4-hydroxythreonine-4-phosphate dehydrogenase PdxA [Alkalinema sp. FACHB-956]MBD2328742.1 4-hydroxythreonine-4-phosphate dehydrogenase PdxA [Alkalinema sp. FACHB-956]
MGPGEIRRPRLVISLGDPAGIGPEVVLKALADPEIAAVAEVTIAGSRSILEATYQRLQHQGVALPDWADLNDWEVPIDPTTLTQIEMGLGNAASGAASFRYLDAAISATLAGQFDGVVTAPIAKSAWKAAGHCYPGQTELLAERAEVAQFAMAFVGRSPHTGWILRALLATTHIPLAEVPNALTPELLDHKLALLIQCLHQDFGLSQPRIAIAGLNPHSGEQGQLGREEVDRLNAWFTQAQQKFPQATLEGLLPPDTMWVKPGQAWFNPQATVKAHDGYLALYHDQGLIPVKLMAFDRAVNTTIGLPFVRTSPDHGTAFDIAGQGIADATSMKEAIWWGAQLAQARFFKS